MKALKDDSVIIYYGDQKKERTRKQCHSYLRN